MREVEIRDDNLNELEGFLIDCGLFGGIVMREIVIIMGYNAAGKSTIVKEFENNGYHRINRDLTGGTLDGQADLARKALKSGKNKIVLDNTYATIESRESIIAVGKELNLPVKCVWLTTSMEDAQLNACMRMMDRCGKILGPEELKKQKDPNLFPPVALYSWKNRFENKDKKEKHPGKQEPKLEHGFASVDKIAFHRQWGPEYVNKALILDFDDTLRTSTGPKEWPEDVSHVKILPGRTEKLAEYQKQGYLLLGASNQSAIAKGLPYDTAVACFEKTLDLLGHKIEYQFCPHKVPPVSCYCRKPAPGLGAYFIHKHKLNPAECIMVGDATSDQTFATRCGFKFQWTKDFFA